MTIAAESTFEDLRPLLFSLAYRMLGSVGEAEDVVQEAFLRYQRALAGGARIESPRAYLSAVATRLAIDELRSARARRETYVGEWLPEPLVTDADPLHPGHAADPAGAAERADELSMAFLLVLERLGPVERAVFLLHDVFGYRFDEIAGIVERSPDACRQLASRARRRVREQRPRFETSAREREALAERFFAAVSDGDVDGLVELLAADAVVHGDGGGKAPQWATPISGADRVARLLGGVGRQIADHGARLERRAVNGQPGAIVRTADGQVISVFALELSGGRVAAVRSVINPDKLRHLGPVADVWALLRARAARSHRPGTPGAMHLERWTAPTADGPIPNHPRFAVLLYRGVGVHDPEAARALFAGHGWGGAWTDGVFDFHHFHSTSHEVLAVVAGSATLELGGPQGEAFEVTAGDVVVLPAGTGHRRATARDGFTVVGAYPAGQEDYDLLREADDAARERIARLPAPDEDPVGAEGVGGWS